MNVEAVACKCLYAYMCAYLNQLNVPALTVYFGFVSILFN